MSDCAAPRKGSHMEDRQDIQFISEGLKCAVVVFPKPPVCDKAPCVILAHGFCSGQGNAPRRVFAKKPSPGLGYHALVFRLPAFWR